MTRGGRYHLMIGMGALLHAEFTRRESALTSSERRIIRVTPERLDGGRVKGALLSVHLDCARDYGSRSEFIDFFEELPPTLGRQVRALVPGVWYPFASLIALDRLIIDQFGSGDPRFAEELGMYTAQRSLATSSRSGGGPQDFFPRATMLHREWYDFLSSEYVPTGERSGTMLHRGYRAHSLIDCAFMMGFYRECIRLLGGSDALVRETACRCKADSFCAFEIAWSELTPSLHEIVTL